MTSDQTQATLQAKGESAEDLKIIPKDAEILRSLATEVAELAARPIEQEKRQMWYRHNALEPTRPLVFCDPEHGWQEILPPQSLLCEGERARRWEMTLRKEVFWGKMMRDDRVIEPYFNIAHVYYESDWGLSETKVGGEDGGAYTWDAPIETYQDLIQLRFPKIVVDYEATSKVVELAENTFGDVLKVRLKTGWWWSLGMTWTLINLRGLAQMMLDMVDHPKELRKLIGFLRDGHAAKLDFLQENNLLSVNNDGTYVGSGGFGWTHELPQTDFSGRVRTSDMWGFAESQETVGVSPQMFEEFILPYQLSLLNRFGLNCYGCCEPVDNRWHLVSTIPRLRRISVSPWCNIEVMAESLGNRYVYSMKPHPGDLADSRFDEDRIRRKLSHAMRATRNCRVEVIMKDNHTIHNDPRRVIRWVQIAMEESKSL
jgi:hypothetical protein